MGSSYCRLPGIRTTAFRLVRIGLFPFSWPRWLFTRRARSFASGAPLRCSRSSGYRKAAENTADWLAPSSVFGATIFFGTDQIRSTAKLVQRSRFNFLREAQIWYNREPDQAVLSQEFENVIVLSDEFYNEISSHPIPTELQAVRVLSGSPAVLDLFMWLSYRCFSAREEERIPLSGGLGLAAQLGNVEYARPRKFREKLAHWLQVVKTMWPECPAR